MDEQLEGRNAVLEALRAGRPVNKILLAAGTASGPIREITRLAREKNIPVQEVDRKKLDSLGSGASQGVIALAAAKEYVAVDDLLAAAWEKQEAPFLLILDRLEDPQNFGSLLRTADVAGVHGVIIAKNRAVGLTAAVGRASAGAIEYVPVARVTNLSQTIDELKAQGIWIAGADMTGETLYYQANLTGPLALVIGSEGEGISRLVREKCDFLVRIPLQGKISSLNAAVAGAIMLFEAVRQRVSKGSGRAGHGLGQA